MRQVLRVGFLVLATCIMMGEHGHAESYEFYNHEIRNATNDSMEISFAVKGCIVGVEIIGRGTDYHRVPSFHFNRIANITRNILRKGGPDEYVCKYVFSSIEFDYIDLSKERVTSAIADDVTVSMLHWDQDKQNAIAYIKGCLNGAYRFRSVNKKRTPKDRIPSIEMLYSAMLGEVKSKGVCQMVISLAWD